MMTRTGRITRLHPGGLHAPTFQTPMSFSFFFFFLYGDSVYVSLSLFANSSHGEYDKDVRYFLFRMRRPE